MWSLAVLIIYLKIIFQVLLETAIFDIDFCEHWVRVIHKTRSTDICECVVTNIKTFVSNLLRNPLQSPEVFIFTLSVVSGFSLSLIFYWGLGFQSFTSKVLSTLWFETPFSWNLKLYVCLMMSNHSISICTLVCTTNDFIF